MNLKILSKSIAFNTGISFLARISGTIAALVTIGFLTRYLGPKGFGEYSLILAFLYIFAIIGDFGLYPLLLREISRSVLDPGQLVSYFFSLRFYLLILALGLGISVSFLLPYELHIVKGIIIGAIGYILLTLSQLLMAIFQFYLSIWRAALAELIGRLSQLGLVYFAVIYQRSFLEIVWIFTISSAVIFIINFYLARRLIVFRLVFIPWRKVKEILKKALPITLSIILTIIYFKIDSIFLSLPQINIISPDPVEDVGVYNVAYKVLESLIFFPAMFVGLVAPFLTRYFSDNREKFELIFQKAHNIIVAITIPVVGSLWILAEPIVVLIGGEKFSAATPVLKIISLAVGLIFLGSLYGQTIIAEGREKKAAFIYGGGVLVNIVLNLIFIPPFRELGAAWTTVATEFFITLFLFLIIKQGCKIRFSFPKLIKILVVSLLLFTFVFYFREQNLFLITGLGALLYLVSIIAVKGIDKDEIRLLLANVVKL